MRILQKTVFVLGCLLLISGCVATHTFSKMARQGDTITIAVGSPEGMTKSNTTVQFVSDVDGSVYNFPIRALFRLRPDNTSYVGTFSDIFSGNIESASSHSAQLSVLVVDLPMGLTVGTGLVKVTTSATYETGGDVNVEDIALEIISGTGSPASFDFYHGLSPGGTLPGNLVILEPLPQVVVKPPVKANWAFPNTDIGAVQMTLNIPMQDKNGGPVPLSEIRVIQDDQYVYNAKSQTQMFWSRSATGDDFTVMFVSPSGTMKFFQPRFSVVINSTNNNQFITTPGPTMTSLTYYDINGNVITSQVPTIADYTVAIE